jgi:SpoVK/Ycf46/Vps4 family AAA+-type ATPase
MTGQQGHRSRNIHRKFYSLFSTIKVKVKGLKIDYPLEVYAKYKDTSEIFIRICSGRNGKNLGEYNLAIQRPEYIPPKPMVMEQAKRARTSAPAKASVEDDLRIKREKEEQERIRHEEELRMQQEREAEVRKIQKAEKFAKAKAELDTLVGLDSVKESINMLVSRLEYESARREALGNKTSTIECPRFVFNGNPGTGKTTVARLIGDICYGCGLLSKGQLVEVSRSDLVGEYIGQTGKATKEACDMAHGGVLFVDEAYSLVQKNENDFGKEAISVLIKEMEDHRKDMIVILAGYTDDMDELLDSNAGISSRITDTITFSDFTAEQLFHIADNMVHIAAYVGRFCGAKRPRCVASGHSF